MIGLLSQTATITPKVASTDDYGNERLTDGEAFDTAGLAQPYGETDGRVDENRSATDWWVFLPAGTEVGRADRITIAGVDLEVVGTPRSVTRATTGEAHHIEARCRLVEG